MQTTKKKPKDFMGSRSNLNVSLNDLIERAIPYKVAIGVSHVSVVARSFLFPFQCLLLYTNFGHKL